MLSGHLLSGCASTLGGHCGLGVGPPCGLGVGLQTEYSHSKPAAPADHHNVSWPAGLGAELSARGKEKQYTAKGLVHVMRVQLTVQIHNLHGSYPLGQGLMKRLIHCRALELVHKLYHSQCGVPPIHVSTGTL